MTKKKNLPLKTKTLQVLKYVLPLFVTKCQRAIKIIIKRRWRWGSTKLCQLCSQSINLIEHVHQNLSMSRLNGQEMIQHTSNVWIIRSSQWRNISINSSSTRRLNSISTCRRGRRGTTPDDAPLGCVEPTLKWVALYLRKVAPMRAIIWTGSPTGKSSRPRNNKILWMKIGWIRAWAIVELLRTLFKEQRNRWGKLIDAPETKAYKNTHHSRGMVWRWEIGHKEWQTIS